MPTKLTKSVTRQTQRTKDRKGRPLVVTLTAGELLTFRPAGHKRVISVSLGHAFNLAQIFSAQDEYLEKMKRYKQRKKMGQRAKKPKALKLPYSSFYYDALNMKKD